MARREVNPEQIIRKDGNGCFVEAMSSAFSIGKVLLRFITYDENKTQGSKITNQIEIYLDLHAFLRISYDILISGATLREIQREKQIADELTKQKGSKQWAKQTILHQGGKPQAALVKAGKARQDGMAEAKVLKIFAGEKLPVMFRAEVGPGEVVKGIIAPRYGFKPEQMVQMGLTHADLKEFLLAIEDSIHSYFNIKSMENAYETKIKMLEAQMQCMKEMLTIISKQVGADVSYALGEFEKTKKDIETPKYAKKNSGDGKKQGEYSYGGQYQQSYAPQNQQPYNNQPQQYNNNQFQQPYNNQPQQYNNNQFQQPYNQFQ